MLEKKQMKGDNMDLLTILYRSRFNKQLEKAVEFLKEDCERYVSFIESSFPATLSESEVSQWVIRQGEYLKGKIDILYSLSALTLDDSDSFKYMVDSCIGKINSQK